MARSLFRSSSVKQGAIGLLLLLSSVVQPSHATMTVHDPIGFIVEFLNQMENQIQAAQAEVMNSQLATQIKNQLETIQQLRDQYLEMQRTADSLSGRTEYGDYLVGPFKMLDPDHTPEDLDDVLWHMRSVGRGNTSDNSLTKEANDYSSLNPYVSLEDYEPTDRNSYRKNDLSNQRSSSLGLISASRLTYKSASTHYSNVRSLQQEIGRTDTAKEALDLNSRILTEIAMLQSEMLRLVSMQSQMQGQQQQQIYNEKAEQLKRKNLGEPVQWSMPK